MLPADYLAQLKAAYPKRDGGNVWSAVPRLIAAHATEMDWPEILRGTQNYYVYCARKDMLGTSFVMASRTFYGRDCHWAEWASLDLRTPQQIATDTKWQQLEQRATALGYTTLDRGRGLSTMESVIRDLENAKGRELVRGLRIVKNVGGA